MPNLPFAVETYHELLTPAQERARVALLEARSLAAAARQARVLERTLHRWLRQDPDFQNELRHLRHEALSHAAARLQQGASIAADTLLTLLQSNDPIELARIRPAAHRLRLRFPFRLLLRPHRPHSPPWKRRTPFEKLAASQKR